MFTSSAQEAREALPQPLCRFKRGVAGRHVLSGSPSGTFVSGGGTGARHSSPSTLGGRAAARSQAKESPARNSLSRRQRLRQHAEPSSKIAARKKKERLETTEPPHTNRRHSTKVRRRLAEYVPDFFKDSRDEAGPFSSNSATRPFDAALSHAALSALRSGASSILSRSICVLPRRAFAGTKAVN
jgi:hypothetical protein